MNTYSEDFLVGIQRITHQIAPQDIENLAQTLANRRSGRLFILGVGGSAANASHAVNDFRKVCGFEAYAPTDNVAELTAWTNDDSFAMSFARWLKESKLCAKDTVLILSVGGGSAAVSLILCEAILYAVRRQATIVGIVGRDGGYTAHYADICVTIPPVYQDRVTPYTESLQLVILHLLVSHPLLQIRSARWEPLQ